MDTGVTIPAGDQYLIPPQDSSLWASSTDVEPYLLSGDLAVFDGELYLLPRYGLGLLKSNNVLINEFYTLVNDSGVLVGNGSILNIYE